MSHRPHMSRPYMSHHVTNIDEIDFESSLKLVVRCAVWFYPYVGLNTCLHVRCWTVSFWFACSLIVFICENGYVKRSRCNHWQCHQIQVHQLILISRNATGNVIGHCRSYQTDNKTYRHGREENYPCMGRLGWRSSVQLQDSCFGVLVQSCMYIPLPH